MPLEVVHRKLPTPALAQPKGNRQAEPMSCTVRADATVEDSGQQFLGDPVSRIHDPATRLPFWRAVDLNRDRSSRGRISQSVLHEILENTMDVVFGCLDRDRLDHI